MLAHPTLDKLNSMGLAGMAKAFGELRHQRRSRTSRTPSGWDCCSNGNGVPATIASLPHASGSPSCVTRRPWKMSITAASAALIARSS